MSDAKKYDCQEQEPFVVAEPVVAAYEVACGAVAYDCFDSRRDEISRAITGEELLNRLRPRIKSMFK